MSKMTSADYCIVNLISIMVIIERYSLNNVSSRTSKPYQTMLTYMHSDNCDNSDNER